MRGLEGEALCQANRVLGDEGEWYVQRLAKLTRRLHGFTYHFMPAAEYGNLIATNLSAAMHVYWREIVFRAHFCAATALIRSERWLSGALWAAHGQNLAAFAACYRGFLEAAADAHEALTPVPATLAKGHTIIRKAVHGHLEDMVLAPELEDRLIHFSHARRLEKGEEVPETHRAKTAAAYLRSLEDDLIVQCYGVLCEITHPAALSVMSFAEKTEDGTVYRLAQDGDEEIIDVFCGEYVGVVRTLMSLGLNPSITILAVINELPFGSLRTPGLDAFPMENLPAWKEILSDLQSESSAEIREADDQDFQQYGIRR